MMQLEVKQVVEFLRIGKRCKCKQGILRINWKNKGVTSGLS